jgi:hypothetical protein
MNAIPLTVAYVAGMLAKDDTRKALEGKAVATRNAEYFRPDELEPAGLVVIAEDLPEGKAELITEAYEKAGVKVVSLNDYLDGVPAKQAEKAAFNPDAPVKDTKPKKAA